VLRLWRRTTHAHGQSSTSATFRVVRHRTHLTRLVELSARLTSMQAPRRRSPGAHLTRGGSPGKRPSSRVQGQPGTSPVERPTPLRIGQADVRTAEEPNRRKGQTARGDSDASPGNAHRRQEAAETPTAGVPDTAAAPRRASRRRQARPGPLGSNRRECWPLTDVSPMLTGETGLRLPSMRPCRSRTRTSPSPPLRSRQRPLNLRHAAVA